MRTPVTIQRRQFLVGLQGAALAIPFLPSLAPRAMAQPAVRKKFISFRISHGFHGQQWYPSDAAISGAQGLKLVEPNVREMMLSDIQGPISMLLNARFDPFRSKMILMRHIDRLDHSDHNESNSLFGWAFGRTAYQAANLVGAPPSIDKLMAQKLYGGMVQPLTLTVSWTNQSSSFSVTPTGALVPDPPLFPQQAYQKLFAGLVVTPGMETLATRKRAYNRSIIDNVLPHYRAVRDNPRLSSAHKAILEQHIEQLNSVHQLLERTFTGCSAPTTPANFSTNLTPEQVTPAAQAQVDIAVAALRCGMTPIVNLFLNPDVLMTEALHGCYRHHDRSHGDSPNDIRQVGNAHLWHLGHLADLLGKLDASVDLDGKTLLDNSLVFLTNEIGNMANQDGTGTDLNHMGIDSQVLLVGSAGGALRTGTFLDYRTDLVRSRWTRYIGTAYNRLLVSCMLAMGLKPQDWEVGGKPGYGDMRGGAFNQTPPDKVVTGDLRAYLPRIKAG